MGSTQDSIQRLDLDFAVPTQQAEDRPRMDMALPTTGRIWKDQQQLAVSSLHSDSTGSHEEVYVVVELTCNEEASRSFTEHIFPYQDGDACIHFDGEQAQAILRLARIAATKEQLETLRHTSTIVGYDFKTKEEVAQRFPALFDPRAYEAQQRRSVKARRGITH